MAAISHVFTIRRQPAMAPTAERHTEEQIIVYRGSKSRGQASEGAESENARLKKLLAHAMLDSAALKHLLAKCMVRPSVPGSLERDETTVA
jgi:hypothetical protein